MSWFLFSIDVRFGSFILLIIMFQAFGSWLKQRPFKRQPVKRESDVICE